MPPSDPLGLLGETLADKYVVESVVGAGGFATVYRAQHLVWRRPVALKVFNILGDASGGLLGRHQELVDAFLREGAILAELSERSPAICQARDAGTLTTRFGTTLPYLVLEWLDGSTLADLLDVEADRGRKLRTMEEAVRLLEPIAHALALAHQCGIVHRDVKPANIFVLDDPTDGRYALKLLDFGVAKVRSGAEAMAVTAGAFTAFTPAYAAPEQFSRKHGATGPWTDAYALALVLVELVTRREAQGGVDIAAVAAVACNLEVRPTPRTRGAKITDEVEAVFCKALAVAPSERYADIAALWTAVHDALEMTPFEAPAKPRSLDGPRSSPRHVDTAPTQDLPMEEIPPLLTRSRTEDPSRTRTTGGRRRRWPIVALLSAAVATMVGVVSARSRTRMPAVTSVAPVPARPLSSRASAPPASTCPANMVPIPAGSFFMGDDDGTKYERPAHQVHLAPFCMDRFEVTVASYKACSDRGECKRAGLTNTWADINSREHDAFDPLCNASDPASHAQHPINCVDWEMASDFCRAHEKRLPTEAEWEFAARGPDGRCYPWGDDPPSARLLNACGSECEAWGKKHGEDEHAMYRADDGFATTAPVGSFPAGASRYGVEDVVGNVWEWVDDWFAPYATANQASGRGPEQGTERVIRGGAWNGGDPSWVRPTFRFKAAPTDRSYGTGFRCAAALAPSE